MWNTDNVWFDISLVTGITAFGQIFFGHFEIHTPRWRKVLKLTFFIALISILHITLGRAWSLGLIGCLMVLVAIIHGFVLPAKGINGWTAEPREKYYKFRGWEKYL